jgi:hypothetical protein
LIKQKPRGSYLSDGTETWGTIRNFPESILLTKKNLRSEINSFLSATSVLIGKCLGVGIPPEDKIERRINKRLSADESRIPPQQPQLMHTTSGTLIPEENSPEEIRVKCVRNIQGLRESFRPLVAGGPAPLAFRMVSQIELVHNAKDNRMEILNFLHAASSLRCENFKLKPLAKYKIEQTIFDSPVHLDTVASIGASLAIMELLKLLTVSFK